MYMDMIAMDMIVNVHLLDNTHDAVLISWKDNISVGLQAYSIKNLLNLAWWDHLNSWSRGCTGI